MNRRYKRLIYKTGTTLFLLETFGQEAYEQAVSEEQRKLTAERLARRGAEGMLIR